mgnify:CR=1 FL=1
MLTHKQWAGAFALAVPACQRFYSFAARGEHSLVLPVVNRLTVRHLRIFLNASKYEPPRNWGIAILEVCRTIAQGLDARTIREQVNHSIS